MDLRTTVISVIILAVLFSAQGAASSMQGPSGTEPFRDDNVAQGIDHSKPNSWLVYELEKKLVAARGNLSGLSGSEIDSMVAQVTPPSAWKPAVASKGKQNILLFLVDFPDWPHGGVQTVYDIDSKMNGPGDPDRWPTDNLADFYARSSYGQLDFDVYNYDWYRASHYRHYYNGTMGRYALIDELLTAYDPYIDYRNFDNDKDGDIDNVWIVWTGPNEGWGSWWWAYQPNIDYKYITKKTWDDVYPFAYVWEWYNGDGNTSVLFDARTPCHEMGHALGLPDYYDYDDTVGPDGGAGGFDMMDSDWPDHNGFSKYLLGWTQPAVIGDNPHTTTGGLYPLGGNQAQNSVIIMPGASADSWGELFLVENRAPGYGNDPDFRWIVDNTGTYWIHTPWTERGLTIWHVDATVNPATQNFKYDNSYTDHKILRLMEADGKEEVEQNIRGWEPGDLYTSGTFFGPTTTPNSNKYSGGSTAVTIHDIRPDALNGVMWARFSIGDYPPAITSISPVSGVENTEIFMYIDGSGFWLNPAPTVYFLYPRNIGGIDHWYIKTATDVTADSRDVLTCTFDLNNVPPGTYTIFVRNPDGKSASLPDALTVRPPWIQVVVPNGGDDWYTGTTHQILWSESGLDETNVGIELWKGWPGTKQRVIATSVPATPGSFSWTIPADLPSSNRYWVNISSLSYPSVYDYTDGWLTLTQPVPSLSVIKSISWDNHTWEDDVINVTAGGTVFYNITIQNTGNVMLNSVALEDDGSYSTISRLAPGASWKQYYSTTAGSTDHINVATVSGTSDFGNAPSVIDYAKYRVVATALSVQPAVTNITVGSTKTVTIVLDRAPKGLSQYGLTITSENPATAQVLSVDFPAWAGLFNSTSGLPGDTFQMIAVDFGDGVKPGATNVVLGTLTVRGDAVGTTAFTIRADWIDDDTFSPIAPAALPGSVRVYPRSLVSFVPASATVAKGGTTEVALVMDLAPLGLSSYNFTVTASNKTVTDVTAVTFPSWATGSGYTPLPADTLVIRASDGTNGVRPGAANILLANLTIRGSVRGVTTISVSYRNAKDDYLSPFWPDGATLSVTVLDGVLPLPGYTSPPTDPDGDGIYEDLNANGRLDFADIVLFFNQMDWIEANEPIAAFDLNGNGRIDFADIVALFNEI